MDSHRLSGLPRVIDLDCRILILGSFPGKKSLESKDCEYYANPTNQFWKIMQKMFGIRESLSYPERIFLLKKHQLGLWDIISSCERPGSRDSAIKEPEHNDIYTLIKEHPKIHLIILNGKSKTRKEMMKYCKKLNQQSESFPDTLKIRCAPSTSPLNRTPVEEKTEQWKKVMDV